MTGHGRTAGYFIKIKYNKEFYLPCSLMEGYVFQELFNDLSKINRYINFDKNTNEFIDDSFAKKYKITFDFAQYKGELYKRDVRFIQRYPSLNIALILFLIGTITILPVLFAFLGRTVLSAIYGGGYPLYRIFLITLSSFPLTAIIGNLAAALVSQYLGHKVTIISAAVSFILIAIGLL